MDTTQPIHHTDSVPLREADRSRGVPRGRHRHQDPAAVAKPEMGEGEGQGSVSFFDYLGVDLNPGVLLGGMNHPWV